MKITNGVVREAVVRFDRDIFLSVWLFIDHEDGGTQGFGGYVLGGLPSAACGKHDQQPNLAAEFLVGVMQACDVEKFNDCVGKAVRVMRESDDWSTPIVGIGHVIKNDRWFNAKERMKKMCGKSEG
jgi:hypothetical protein